MINRQKLSYKVYEDKIPISKTLLSYLKTNNLNKSRFLSNGDDYQILFTASPSKARIILGVSKKLRVKISKIGKICNASQKSEIIDQKGMKIAVKNKGFYHNF